MNVVSIGAETTDGTARRVIERRAPEPAAAGIAWPPDLHPVLRQVYERRRITSLADLDLGLAGLPPVGSFAELDAAVELLLAHRDGRIVVVGDFDSDGATSAALLLICLRAFGFNDVSYFIPDRFELGYGLTPEAVARVAERRPDLIVTVDNGISSVTGVASARERGIDVLVTDHHLPPEQLPAANAIVNPNVPGVAFGGKHLAGVGVAFYLMAALGHRLGAAAKVADCLDLVALGTVADLVPLDRGNRILVQQGLARIRAGRCRPGVRALCEVAGLTPANVTAGSLGFQLAPRLNAAGRLDDMSIGVQCLLADTDAAARALAERLDTLNRERRDIEARMRDDAMAIVDRLELEGLGAAASVLSLCRDDWHEGLVGLIASRVKDRVHLPTFAFAPAGAGDLKGSGRSVPGFHLRDALALVDARHPGLITRFGGHAMAAGLTLRREDLPAFAAAIDAVGAAELTAEQRLRRVLTDGELGADDYDPEVADLLQRAGPWGQGFPEPLFEGRFRVVDWRLLKDAHLKMKLRVHGHSRLVDAIAFNAERRALAPEQELRLAFRLETNDYFAERRAQLVVEHLEDAEARS